MSDYDIYHVMSASELTEDDRRAEAKLDAEDDARYAAEAAAAEAADDGRECYGEVIDGSWVYCPCEGCQDHEAASDEDDEEPW